MVRPYLGLLCMAMMVEGMQRVVVTLRQVAAKMLNHCLLALRPALRQT